MWTLPANFMLRKIYKHFFSLHIGDGQIRNSILLLKISADLLTWVRSHQWLHLASLTSPPILAESRRRQSTKLDKLRRIIIFMSFDYFNFLSLSPESLRISAMLNNSPKLASFSIAISAHTYWNFTINIRTITMSSVTQPRPEQESFLAHHIG